MLCYRGVNRQFYEVCSDLSSCLIRLIRLRYTRMPNFVSSCRLATSRSAAYQGADTAPRYQTTANAEEHYEELPLCPTLHGHIHTHTHMLTRVTCITLTSFASPTSIATTNITGDPCSPFLISRFLLTARGVCWLSLGFIPAL